MNNTKRVVLLTAMDPYRDIRAVKIANSLYDEGYDVSLVAGFADKEFVRETNFSIFDYNIPYNTRASIIKKIIWKFRFFLSSINKVRRIDPHIVHACNIDMLLLAYLYGFKNKKIIYDSYEICAHKSGVASESKTLSKLIENTEKFLIKKIDYMICVSNSARKYFIDKYGVKNIQTITNVPKVKNHKIFGPTNIPRCVLYLGNFSVNRGIEELILAGRYIDPLVAKIHLQGYGAYKEEYLNIIQDNNLGRIVHLIPPIMPDAVIDEISEKADIGVVLTKPTSINHQLTVSNKIFDYINAGLPVIMSNVEEHKYINEKYNIGIILDDITPKNISDAIMKLSSKNDLYSFFSKNCLDAAKSLNWNREELKLLNIYNSISGERNKVD
ncbi:glycosyltransferase [Desulfosporosinus sp.]|uniref:glycosyltransferase n=1 Tax=Desulfosporosinus sp. TaxID=157907 RepID=UPI0025C4C759|nr:glycosyltransferase [Desulfosporosinus sp.]MBC2726055.1 glycosyltransferase [Desulfosporosinus sp.]